MPDDLFPLLDLPWEAPAAPPVRDTRPPHLPIVPSGQIAGPSVDPGPLPEPSWNNPGLRDYQRDVIRQFWRQVAGKNRKVLLVMPTGAGKTVTAVEIIDQALQQRMRVLFLAHRRELVSQASQTLHRAHLDHGIIQAGYQSRLYEKVQVASVQTVHARAVRSSVIEMPEFELVVVDEAHRSTARSYRDIVQEFPNAIVLGLTATPCRGDGKGLGTIFDYMVVGLDVSDLIAQGHLVGTKVYAPSTPDLTGVKIRAGDYAEDQLSKRMDTAKLVGDVVLHWQRLASERQTIVFASSVAHSVHLTDEFRKAGVMAEHIDGTTPSEERDSILKRLANGQVQVVVNCQVLTEGFDCPDVSCIVLARPTKSVSLFRQMVGRGLRPAEGKDHLLLLDHAGAVFEHGFIDEPIHWTLKDNERAENRRQEARKAGAVPKLVACPECAAINWQGRPCSACGWRPRVKPHAVATRDGVLEEVDKTRKPKGPRDKAEWDPVVFHGMLLSVCDARGHKPGWVAYKYKTKFGRWPPRVEPERIPPDLAILQWIKAQNIAFAKSRGL